MPLPTRTQQFGLVLLLTVLLVYVLLRSVLI
jgi:hypothetical protein